MKKDDTVFNFLVIPTIKYALKHGVSAEIQTQILRQDISNPDFTDLRIAPHQFIDLITTIRSTVGDEYLGLHIGEMLRISSLGILGYVLMNCEDIEHVADKLVAYQELAGNFVALTYEKTASQIIQVYLCQMINSHL